MAWAAQNEILPGVRRDVRSRRAAGCPRGSAQLEQRAFLPGAYQGTYGCKPGREPIANLEAARRAVMTDGPAAGSAGRWSSEAQPIGTRSNISADDASWKRGSRASSWPTGCSRPRRRRSTSRPSPQAHQEALRRRTTRAVRPCRAKQCLTARRLVERGVRFVQIYSGGMENERSWDGHIDIKPATTTQFAGETDQADRRPC